MTTTTSILRQSLWRTARFPHHAKRTDGELLEQFLNGKEEEAFQTLVQRHGPMVLGVCRRVLQNSHDAEDAFQAAFLVLVRKGQSFLKPKTIGNWLYGVAFKTALKARAANVKRRAKEMRAMERQPADAGEREFDAELLSILDQALSKLPDKYRQAVILCELQGTPRKQAAELLAIPEGTLSSRLATARRMLAKRLARHGCAVSTGTLTAVLAPGALSAGVPASLTAATVKAASKMAVGSTAGTGVVSAKVAVLTDGVMKTMFLAKLKSATVVVLAVCLLGVGIGQLTVFGSEYSQAEQARHAAPAPVDAVGAKTVISKGPTARLSETTADDTRPAESVNIPVVNGTMKVPLMGRYKTVTIGEVSGNGVVEAVDFDAEEVVIGTISGNGILSFKGKVKKLTIGTIKGAGKIDASGLAAGAVEIGEIGGAANINLQSIGTVRFTAPVEGAPQITVNAQSDVSFDKTVKGAGNIEVTTRGNVLVAEQLRGACTLKAPLCKDFIVQGQVGDAVQVDVSYFGQAVCPGGDPALIRLNKVAEPK